MLGYVEEVGIDDENRHDPKEYRDDFYKGQTDSFVGTRAPFTTKITITGPADFTLNSVGTKTADTVKDGRRTVVWESDHPVSFFNVIAGRWQVERGRRDGRLLSSRPIPTTSPRCARRSTPPAAITPSGFTLIPGAS